MNKFLIIILIILMILIFTYFRSKENYTQLINNEFFTYLKENGYKVDTVNKLIYKDDKKVSYFRYFNTKESANLADNKNLSSTYLNNYNIPVPKFIGLNRNNYYNLNNLISENKMSFPFVAKRVNGSFGLGIETNINDMLTLKDVSKKLLSKYSNIQIEEQGKGNCYRILLFNFKIIDIICREKPYVIGDGKRTVNNLIQIKNSELKKVNKNYKISNVSDRYLQSQGYSLNSILPNNVKIYVTNIINMANGASSYRVDINKIPECNKKMFIDTAKKINIKCAGIDYLSDDINVEYYKNKGKILELNCRPDIDMHLENEPYKNSFYDNVIQNLN